MTLTVVAPCGVLPVTTAGLLAGNPEPVTATKELPNGRPASWTGGGALVVPQATAQNPRSARLSPSATTRSLRLLERGAADRRPAKSRFSHFTESNVRGVRRRRPGWAAQAR